MFKESQTEEFTPAPPRAAGKSRPLSFLGDVKLQCSVEFGRARFTIRRFLELGAGSVIELDKLQGEPVDIRVSGRLAARGEVVVVNDRYGVRITEIVSEGAAEERP
jgi:flagellar motor switch protein FliN